GAAAATVVAHPVFLPVGVVGVARAKAISDVAIVPRPLIGVLDHQLYRSARRHSVEDAAEDLHQILFLPLCRVARLAGFAHVEPLLDVGLGERQARRHPVDHYPYRRPVAFAPGGETEQGAERVARHGFRLAYQKRGTARARSPARVIASPR